MTHLEASIETRLARAALSGGDPLTALQTLLAALESTPWALALQGEAALYRLLGRVLGPGIIRLDPLLLADEAALRAAGLEPGGLEPDWRGARAVWLLEPDDRALNRARKAGVPVIADASLAPGGAWLARGASYVVYRHAAALGGHAEPAFAALLGSGEAPSGDEAVGALGAALLLRDLASLPPRLGRQGRAAVTLAEVLGERARHVSGSTLLVAGELGTLSSGPSRTAPLGGVVTASRQTAQGWLLSVGLERPEELLAALGEAAPALELSPEVPATLQEALEQPTEAHAEPAPTPSRKGKAPHPAPPPNLPLLSDEAIAPDLPPAEARDPAEDLSEPQHAAYLRLREWRNAEAKRQEVSRFIVASNATLAEVARRAPQTLGDLHGIKGLGPQRLARYGEKLVELARG